MNLGNEAETVIIGAGLAGLACARRLQEAGVNAVVLEAGDAVGGRVRTDVVDGFRIDRGFQVFLTAYPEARRWLNYEALELRAFTPGALVWVDGGVHRVGDPLRRPGDLWATLRAPVGSLADKLRIASLRAKAARGSLDDVFARPETTALEALRAHGFGERMIERFLRPWLGGIFLERELATSSRMLEFVFRMFAQGFAAVPARGMQAIPEQLASALTAGTLRLNTRVTALAARDAGGALLTLANGERLAARRVVIATEGDVAARLLGESPATMWRATVTLSFAAERSPLGEPTLWLNGTGRGIVNNVVVMSDVSAGYAPGGEALVSVSVIGDAAGVTDETLAAQVRAELGTYFGADAAGWRLLRLQRIARALPARRSVTRADVREAVAGVWVCGDHLATASINGALESGRRVAEALLGQR